MSLKDQKIVTSLRRKAETTIPVSRARIAAMLVCGKDKYVAVNRRHSHPLQAKYCKHPESIFLHAETGAIVKALKEKDAEELEGSTLYIVRRKLLKDRSSKLAWCDGLAKPCKGCRSLIEDLKIGRVVYTTDELICEELQ
jgi:deoxycytidylate deaminase